MQLRNGALIQSITRQIVPIVLLVSTLRRRVETQNQIGDLILPIAAIRGEGTSNDYLPPEVLRCPRSSCNARCQR
jgi:AMP nucleosidase